MNSKKVFLVTGGAGYWGAHIAARLHQEPDLHVIGLDEKPPFLEIEGLDYVNIGLDNPILHEFLRSEKVETICHLESTKHSQPNQANGGESSKVTGYILEAAKRARVQQIVIKSSTAVYGAHPDNPALLTEDMALRGSRATKYGRDLLETETLVKESRISGSSPSIALLRFANIVGSAAATPFTRFLCQPSTKVLLGFDPVIQLVHAEDVVEAIAHAAMNNIGEEYNVAAAGVMPLSRIMRVLRKIPIPIFHPFAYRAQAFVASGRLKYHSSVPIEWDYLRYPWIADTARMNDKMGFSPARDCEQALLEFAGREAQISEESTTVGGPPDIIYLQELIKQREQKRANDSDNPEGD